MESNGLQDGSKVQEGLWSVVSKQQHPRKNNENDLTMVCGGPMKVHIGDNAGAKSMESRFSILDKDIPNLEVENLEDEKIMKENISQKIIKNRQRENVSLENIKRKIINGPFTKSVESPTESYKNN